MLSSTTALAISELTIYLALAPFIIYHLVRHGKDGLLGWGYLLVFAVLQLAGAGIQVETKNSRGSGATITNSIGLSPLLLATLGILHEAKVRSASASRKLSSLVYIFLHIIVMGGLALVAAGASGLLSSNPKQSDLILWKAGSLVLLLVLIVLILYAASLFRGLRNSHEEQVAKPLLNAVVWALPFIGVRALYSVIYAFTQSKVLSPLTGSTAVKVVLVFLPGLLTTLLLLIGGHLSYKAGYNDRRHKAPREIQAMPLELVHRRGDKSNSKG